MLYKKVVWLVLLSSIIYILWKFVSPQQLLNQPRVSSSGSLLSNFQAQQFSSLEIMASIATKMMRAAVVHTPGGPEVLTLQNIPIPTPQKGQVLMRVRAFGLNRAEMFTRQGHSPGVKFPRVLGIEATGEVAAAPGGEFAEGAVVATVMGGMGRGFDGGYAEYTLVPASQVKEVKVKDIGWDVLGALPEMVQTAWGALFTSLQLKKGDRLLIRAGTSSVGLAAAAIAKHHGAFVVSTTRSENRAQLLKESGAEDVIVDGGSIAEEARRRYPDGFDKILELVGVISLKDSMRTLKRGGVCCVAGIVGGRWVLEQFTPNEVIPTGTYLTTYGSSVEAFMETPLDEVAQLVKNGSIHIPIKTYRLDQIVEAHRDMEETSVGAKMVVLVD
jgi:NADPH:quinone reductase-like Zn-dependent oxidoreductase